MKIKIKELVKVPLEKGDIIVLRIQDRLSKDQLDNLSHSFIQGLEKRGFTKDDVTFFILEEGVNIEVIKIYNK